MRFLRYKLGYTRLDRERNQSVMERRGVRSTVLEIEQYPKKWLLTENGQKQDTHAGTEV